MYLFVVMQQQFIEDLVQFTHHSSGFANLLITTNGSIIYAPTFTLGFWQVTYSADTCLLGGEKIQLSLGPNSASSLFHEAGCTRELSRGSTLSCPTGWRLGGNLSLAIVSAKYVTLGDYMRLPLFYVSIGHSSLYLHLVRNSDSSPVRFGAKSWHRHFKYCRLVK